VYKRQALGEANFSDHGANRLGASALMQGLADGYFVAPYTITNYLASNKLQPVKTDHDAFKEAEATSRERIDKILRVKGRKSPNQFHRELGKIIWDKCGMARSKQGLEEALRRLPELRQEFWENVSVPGSGDSFNTALDHATRVADFLEFGELMCHDALQRDESCGAHFRVEHQYDDGEAKRNDDQYAYVSAWGHQGEGKAPVLNAEPLVYENVHLAVRSYK
jgi:succinate dehydrogenase / fumarate reductase flavoprotein subunit